MFIREEWFVYSYQTTSRHWTQIPRQIQMMILTWMIIISYNPYPPDNEDFCLGKVVRAKGVQSQNWIVTWTFSHEKHCDVVYPMIILETKSSWIYLFVCKFGDGIEYPLYSLMASAWKLFHVTYHSV